MSKSYLRYLLPQTSWNFLRILLFVPVSVRVQSRKRKCTIILRGKVLIHTIYIINYDRKNSNEEMIVRNEENFTE